MKDWIDALIGYIISSWQDLTLGGVVAVSLVIFVLGCIKPCIKSHIPNKILRKVILAWMSIILSVPATIGSMWINNLSEEYFWVYVCFNAVSTIVIYFFYENTATRDLLHWIGKHIWNRFIVCVKAGIAPDRKDLIQEVTNLLENSEKSTTKTSYDDTLNI